MQHGVDRHREESQLSEPRDPTVREDLSNSLHLSWRERALLPNLKAFVPGAPFGRQLFLERHSFSLLWVVYPFLRRPIGSPPFQLSAGEKMSCFTCQECQQYRSAI